MQDAMPMPAPPTTGNNFGEEVNGQKFRELAKQFNDAFFTGLMTSRPVIKKIYNVHNKELMDKYQACAEDVGSVQCHGHGQNPGNQQRRFHQSNTLCDFNGEPCNQAACATCSIIKTGFDMKSNSKFGPGIYSTSSSSTAYGDGNKKAMFVVGVVCGNVDLNQKHPNLRDGYHSKAVSETLDPSDELMVFKNEAIVPKFLMVFE